MTMAAPETIPEPPADLADRDLPIHLIDSSVLYRGHKRRYGAVYFNPVFGRWSDPTGEFGTMYAGETDYCSFAEAFVLGTDRRFVSQSVLDQSCLCQIAVTGKLSLVDLTIGPSLMGIGADNRISDGPHDVARRWSRAFWSHPAQPDGIYYRSRNAPEMYSVALYDRTADLIESDCRRNLLADPTELARLLDYFGCALLP